MDMWMIVALLGLVIILYASMLPRTPDRKPVPDDFLDSVGDTLQQFADEIESENKELIRMVGDMKREHEQRTEKLLARIEQLEKQSAPVEVRKLAPSPVAPNRSEADVVIVPELPVREGASVRRSAADIAAAIRTASIETPVPVSNEAVAATPPEPEDKPAPETASRFSNTVKSRYKEVFDMHDSGKSIEYIAKKLGKNKGEVQLIIGLAKQEEPQHGQP